MIRTSVWLQIAVLAGLAPCLHAEIALTDCMLGGSQGVATVEARCGWLERPENPEDPGSTTLALKVAVVPSLSPNPRRDAFTVINGGPGGSSLDMFADLAGLFTAILRERDILVMDQRGTGASHPMDCPELEAVSQTTTAERINEATRACLDSLPGDPRYYTTSVAVRDLEALRIALGYEALDVYGVSYGTRVAQHYARRYPESVRTLIIDGVVPPELPLGPNAAANAQRVLDRLFARCAADAACTKRFPDLPHQLEALKERLKGTAVSLTLAHPVTGNGEHINLSHDHLLLTLRLLSYAPETINLIPLIIDEAQARGNYTPLASHALRIEEDLRGAIRFGMHNSVICTEDAPYYRDADIEALAATYMGPEQARALQAICALWPKGQLDGDLREPLTVGVPTLILSGEEDPITPPEYGAMAAEHLPERLHLIGGGQGHGVIARGCFPRLVSRFVETGDLEGLDTDCVDRLTHGPFFLNLMGPVSVSPGEGE